MKQGLLDVAEVLDAYRVFPRAYMLAFIYMLVHGHYWYVHLDIPTVEQSGYLKAMWAATAAATGFYVATGRKWSG